MEKILAEAEKLKEDGAVLRVTHSVWAPYHPTYKKRGMIWKAMNVKPLSVMDKLPARVPVVRRATIDFRDEESLHKFKENLPEIVNGKRVFGSRNNAPHIRIRDRARIYFDRAGKRLVISYFQRSYPVSEMPKSQVNLLENVLLRDQRKAFNAKRTAARIIARKKGEHLFRD
jgi:hypothetical protein